MQAVNSILGTTIFGNPGGSHVVIGVDGSITGYYADGRIAYDLVPGANAAITTYGDVATHYPRLAMTGGTLSFTENVGENVTFIPSEISIGQSVLDIITTAPTINADFPLYLTGTGTVAWGNAHQKTNVTPGAQWSFTGVGGGVAPAQYWVDSTDTGFIKGGMVATATFSGSSALFTLPVSVRPLAGAYRDGLDVYTSGGVWKGRAGLIVNTNGTCQTNGFSFTTGDIIAISAFFPLDNIS